MIDVPYELAYQLATATEMLMADLYTFTLKSGEVLHYTSAGVPLTIDGNQYSNELSLARGGISVKAGIEVDELQITIYPSETNLLKGVPFLHGIRAGFLDGATLTLRRAFFGRNWGYCYGTIMRFSGRVSDITDYSRTEIPITIKSWLELLNVKMPRNVYQPACRRTLYDAGCLVTKSAYQLSSAVASGSTATSILCGLTSQEAGYYDMGEVVFTSGVNTGVSRTVKKHTSGNLVFALPLPYMPAVGDTFLAFPGCNHTMATCQTKFNNLTNFSGEPFVPVAETAY